MAIGTTATGPWTDISVNGTSATYDVPSATNGSFYYRVIVTDVASGCSDPVSNVINVIITQDLVVTTEPANITECIGGTAQMTVVVSGGSGTTTYQWHPVLMEVIPGQMQLEQDSTTATFTPPSTVAGQPIIAY
jgi:hypothetical protein